jgi:hypothetical protein
MKRAGSDAIRSYSAGGISMVSTHASVAHSQWKGSSCCTPCCLAPSSIRSLMDRKTSSLRAAALAKSTPPIVPTIHRERQELARHASGVCCPPIAALDYGATSVANPLPTRAATRAGPLCNDAEIRLPPAHHEYRRCVERGSRCRMTLGERGPERRFGWIEGRARRRRSSSCLSNPGAPLPDRERRCVTTSRIATRLSIPVKWKFVRVA